MWKHGTLSQSLSILAVGVCSASAQTYDTSAPFKLQIHSATDGTVDGQFLNSVHVGAAVEALALLGHGQHAVYTLETPTPETSILIHVLATQPDPTILELAFPPGATGNVVTPLFSPPAGQGAYVGFDDQNRMFSYLGYWDESISVPTHPSSQTGKAMPQYQWHACWTDISVYHYYTLSWVLGGVPDNPTCAPVDVTRVFL